jgi:hypothetical protein
MVEDQLRKSEALASRLEKAEVLGCKPRVADN